MRRGNGNMSEAADSRPERRRMTEEAVAATLRARYATEEALDREEALRLVALRDKALEEGLTADEQLERLTLTQSREDREPRLLKTWTREALAFARAHWPLVIGKQGTSGPIIPAWRRPVGSVADTLPRSPVVSVTETPGHQLRGLLRPGRPPRRAGGCPARGTQSPRCHRGGCGGARVGPWGDTRHRARRQWPDWS